MSQFYNFNFDMNAVNNGCKNPVPARNSGAQVLPNVVNTSNSDTFQKQDKKSDKKNILILGSIIAAVAVLALGIKSGKFKKPFDKFSQNPAKSPAIQATTEKLTDKETENKAVSNPPKVRFLIKNKGKKFRIIKQSENQTISSNTGAMTIKRRPPKLVKRLGNIAIQTILSKEKLTEQDLKKIQTIFKNNTGVSLYCPEIHNIDAFKPFFDLIFDGKFYERMDPKIKHIIIGHGIGSAKQDTWRFMGTGENVFDFIEKNIPKGDTVLAITCEETANRIKPGIGTEVNITLQDAQKPGKIIKAGERRIIGKVTQYEPKIQYFQ